MNSDKRNDPLRLLASAAICGAIGFAGVSITGCDTNDTPGEKVDEAIDEAGDAIDEAADDVEDAVDDAADDIDDAADDATDDPVN